LAATVIYSFIEEHGPKFHGKIRGAHADHDIKQDVMLTLWQLGVLEEVGKAIESGEEGSFDLVRKQVAVIIPPRRKEEKDHREKAKDDASNVLLESVTEFHKQWKLKYQTGDPHVSGIAWLLIALELGRRAIHLPGNGRQRWRLPAARRRSATKTECLPVGQVRATAEVDPDDMQEGKNTHRQQEAEDAVRRALAVAPEQQCEDVRAAMAFLSQEERLRRNGDGWIKELADKSGRRYDCQKKILRRFARLLADVNPRLKLTGV